MRFGKVAIVVASLLTATTGSAATYYVANSGNDANPGTLAAPFKTITKTASIVRAGDTVEVRGGTYNEVVKLSAAKGTSASRIVFRSYAGEKAIIDGTGTAAGTDLVQLGSAQYIDFTGFDVRNSTRLGIAVWNGKGVKISGNAVHGSIRGGIYVGADTFGTVTDIVVDGNDVYNNVLENQAHTMAGGWAQSIGINMADRVTVTNNRVHENDGEGIVFVVADNAVARNNTVYDNYSVGIYFDNAQFCTADANFVYSTGNTRYYRSSLPAAGIGFANEVYSVQNPLTDNKVTNNIVVNTRWGVYYGAYDLGGGLKNTVIANNTFYKSTAAMVWIEADANAGNTVQNNIFSQTGGGVMLLGSAAGTTFRSNFWYGGNAGAAAGTGDILGSNPLFVNAGGLSAADYKLQSLSPAVHRALDSLVTTDFWGGARTPSFDMGAHEQSAALGSGAAAGAEVDAPSNVKATAVSSNEVMVTWNPTAGAAYNVYRDEVKVATVTTNSFRDTNRAANTKYMYEVTTVDAAGHESIKTVAYVMTAAAAVDAQKPTNPSSLSAQATSNGVMLTWADAADNVGVTGYKVYRDGIHIATTTNNAYMDNGIVVGTSHSYYVVAMDAAGNNSEKSNVATLATSTAKRRATRG